MGGKNNSSSDATDAAIEQGKTDKQLARDQTYADRPNQHNPFGSVEWESELYDPITGLTNNGYEGINELQTQLDGITGSNLTADMERALLQRRINDYDPSSEGLVERWTQTQKYTPETQALIDQQMGNMSQRGMMQNQSMQHAQDAMKDAPDWGQFGEAQGLEYNSDEIRQRAEDAAYQRDTMRLDPQMADRRAAMETKMRQQGLRAGDRAWDSQMDTFNQGSNDAYERARLGSVGQGRLEASDDWTRQMQGTNHANALRDKNIAEYTDKRNYSLDEANRIGAGKKDVLDFVGGAG